MHRVQEPELRNDQEQKEDAGPARVQEVLQKMQVSYSSQRDEVIADLRFFDRSLRIGNRDRGIVLAASTAVSKTVRPGSNPGTPATK